MVLGSKSGCRTQFQPTTYPSRVNVADNRGRLFMVFALFSYMCGQHLGCFEGATSISHGILRSFQFFVRVYGLKPRKSRNNGPNSHALLAL